MGQTAPLATRTRPVWVLVALSMVISMTIAAEPTNAQSADGTVRLLPPISAVDVNDGSFSIFIVLEDLEHNGVVSYDDNRDTIPDRDVESIGMAAFEFTLGFDETIVAVEGVEVGPALAESGRAFQCLPPRREPGSFRFGCLSSGESPPGVQGSVTLASLTLRPLSNGSSALLLEPQLAGPLGDPISIDVADGLVRVTGNPDAVATPTQPLAATPTAAPPASAQPTATPQDSPQPTAPTGGATVTVTLQTPTLATPTTATTTAVSPQPTVVDDDTPEPKPNRDTDGDGRSAGTVTRWILAGLGGLTAIGLVATFLRRRNHRGGAS